MYLLGNLNARRIFKNHQHFTKFDFTLTIIVSSISNIHLTSMSQSKLILYKFYLQSINAHVNHRNSDPVAIPPRIAFTRQRSLNILSFILTGCPQCSIVSNAWCNLHNSIFQEIPP